MLSFIIAKIEIKLFLLHNKDIKSVETKFKSINPRINQKKGQNYVEKWK